MAALGSPLTADVGKIKHLVFSTRYDSKNATISQQVVFLWQLSSKKPGMNFTCLTSLKKINFNYQTSLCSFRPDLPWMSPRASKGGLVQTSPLSEGLSGTAATPGCGSSSNHQLWDAEPRRRLAKDAIWETKGCPKKMRPAHNKWRPGGKCRQKTLCFMNLWLSL